MEEQDKLYSKSNKLGKTFTVKKEAPKIEQKKPQQLNLFALM